MSKLAYLVLDLPDPLTEPDSRLPKPTGDDLTDQVNAAFESAQAGSVRAHILACRYHFGVKDHETVIEIAEAGLARLRALEGEIGQRLTGYAAPSSTYTTGCGLINRMYQSKESARAGSSDLTGAPRPSSQSCPSTTAPRFPPLTTSQRSALYPRQSLHLHRFCPFQRSL